MNGEATDFSIAIPPRLCEVVSQEQLTNTIKHLILYRMKVTTILPETLIKEVKKYSKGKNITDSLKIALNEWIEIKHIAHLNEIIAKKPLEFEDAISAGKIREINRKI